MTICLAAIAESETDTKLQSAWKANITAENQKMFDKMPEQKYPIYKYIISSVRTLLPMPSGHPF